VRKNQANRYLPVLPWITGIPPSAHRPLPQRPGANSGGHLIRNRPFEIVLLNGGFVPPQVISRMSAHWFAMISVERLEWARCCLGGVLHGPQLLRGDIYDGQATVICRATSYSRALDQNGNGSFHQNPPFKGNG